MNAPAKEQVRTPAPGKQQQVAAKPVSRFEKMGGFRDAMEARTEQFRQMLTGTGIEVDFFKQVLLTAVQETPDLLDCEQASIWSSAKRAAMDGLLPDGREGKIVVRKKYGKGGDGRPVETGKTANWQIMVQGIRKKVRGSGEVLSFTVDVVHENDEYEYASGDHPHLFHKRPKLGQDRGPKIGAYAIAKLKNGETVYEVMDVHEIHAIRDKFSDSWKSHLKYKSDSPWLPPSDGEMWKKTVARRISKVLPMSTDVRASLNDDDNTLPSAEDRPAIAAPRPQRQQFRDDSDAPMIEHSPAEDMGVTAEDPPREAEKVVAEQSAVEAKAEQQAPAAAEQKSGPAQEESMFFSLRAQLSKAPPEVQNAIWDERIEPNRKKFKEAELSELAALLKDE